MGKLKGSKRDREEKLNVRRKISCYEAKGRLCCCSTANMYSIFNCKHLDAHFQGSAEVFILYPFAGHRPLPAPPATHNLIRRKCSKVFIYGCVLQCDKNKLRKRHVRSISGSTVSLPLRPQSTALFERKTCECINWLNMVLYGSTSDVCGGGDSL